MRGPLQLFTLLGMLLLASCTSPVQFPDPSRGNASDPNLSRATPETGAVGSRRAASPHRPKGAGARDAYVLLSGGGTPLTNNYSQYLQARAVADFFERECRGDATWVFFGVGNREGSTPIMADVRREVKRDGLLLQSWLPGTLRANRPATRDSFLRALRDEILPTVRDGGTLYLFVGDHGELAGTGDKRESAITLWQLKQGRRRAGWSTDLKEILGVAELRQILAAGLGQGRVVFCMTQCHSGGFHELGGAGSMHVPREWYAAVPPAAEFRTATPRLLVAGFTATDEESPAAGCDADPDPERWAGYERFLPESLFGVDLMTGQPKQTDARSFAMAHERATLVDHTIDKPRSTSEHYLDGWARLIETKLANEFRLTDKARAAVEAFRRSVEQGEVVVADAALRERHTQFQRFTAKLIEQVPAAKQVLTTGTQQQLETVIRARATRGGTRGNRRGALAELRRSWSDTLRPAWKAAVLGGTVPELTGPALEFERHLLKIEDDGRELLLPRGGSDTAVMNEVYWHSGYAEPAKTDRLKAEAVVRWGAERRGRIMAWAVTSGDAAVVAAAEKIGPGVPFVEELVRPMSQKTAAERVLFYRRVIAAWQFLVMMDARFALDELHSLIELERTAVRKSGGPTAQTTTAAP